MDADTRGLAAALSSLGIYMYVVTVFFLLFFREPSDGLLPAPPTTRHSACHTHSPTVTWPT